MAPAKNEQKYSTRDKEVSTKFVLGLLATLRELGSDAMASGLLQTEKKAKYFLTQPHGWLSQAQAISLLSRAAALSNEHELPEKLARQILGLPALAALRLMLQSSGSPNDAYRTWLQAHARLGNADLPDYLPGKRNSARFIYYYTPDTPPNPLYCRYRGAILAHIPELLGLPPAEVQEIKCAAQGDRACHYKVRWTKQPFHSKALNGGIIGALVGSGLAILLSFLAPTITVTQLALASLIPFAGSLLTGHLLDLNNLQQRKTRLVAQQHQLLTKQEGQLEQNQETLARFTNKLHQHGQLHINKLTQLNERLNQINYELLQRNLQILREHEALVNQQEQEHSLARSIQQSILLNEQEFQNQTGLLHGALAYQTADQYIGGDFYDYFEDDDRAHVLVGDVSGHGLGAVQVVHSAISYFRSINKKHCPEKLVRTLNSYLKKDLAHLTSYATAIYGVVTSGELQYINAGQRHGFVYKPKEQRFVPMVSSQCPIGSAISENHRFQKRTIPLEKDDLIVIHTDGIIEAHDGNEEFGSHRVEQLIREHYRAPDGKSYPHPQAVKDALFNNVRKFQTPGRADDMTLVMLKY